MSSILGCMALATVMGCSAAGSETYGKPQVQPRGFFASFVDQITERECDVLKFTCPYGFGAAGEPCECVDPKGIVLKGITIK